MQTHSFTNTYKAPLDKQTYTSEFESHWVPLSYCLVPHLSKKLSKFPFTNTCTHKHTHVQTHTHTQRKGRTSIFTNGSVSLFSCACDQCICVCLKHVHVRLLAPWRDPAVRKMVVVVAVVRLAVTYSNVSKDVSRRRYPHDGYASQRSALKR